MERFELLISDCDGVLVDSEVLAERVMCEALAAFVPAEALEHLLVATFGQTTRDMLRRVEERFALQLPDTLLAQIEARSEALTEAEVQPIPGVRQALEQIPLPLAVASNSRRHNVIALVERVGLSARAAGRIFGADMVERPKPAPDVYLLAARTAGVAPERCLVIEDSLTGASAALAAGMQVLGFTGASHIPHGHDETLRRIGVLEVFDAMRDLPALFERLVRKQAG
ncbi:HAD family hydrolase [Xanthomonas fragariae]|uniref:6-phosphogluconate phosphatase n=1 Tax=Xanthomonas fragariae TaxID=48664 RepID=A0A1Y6H4Q1_9XANT|nr:HAD family hydrolase [Xanthomonas fragariae]AOD15515.1 HAD family hydrolase [Xanthomonas fragariae]AOD18923.1 HAD family hydrolase [Xanthomonas fragariae]ENZ97151.1 phosphatase/phosphohexomutase [Xanthomonas fragariae LMG 25863]MBL9196603.1 HAD family hydrolase [Xanthomonas fragariae]MBL9221504.1 HAD family hydrolase [Xanthomonas fragariae]